MSTGRGAGTERLFAGYTGRMFVVVTAGVVAVKIGFDAVPPLLPAIVDDLGISSVEAGVGLSLMSACYALVQYPSGRLADELSATTVLLASLLAASLGLLAITGAVSYGLFLVGVVTIGVGWGLYTTPGRTLLSTLFVDRRGEAFGLHMAASDVSGVVAAGLAVAVLALATWRSAFLPVLLVLVPTAFLLHRASEEPVVVRRVDLGVWETGGRLGRQPHLRWLTVAYVLYIFTVRGVVGFLPTFLQVDHGFSSTFAGVAYAVLFASGLAYKPLAGYVSDAVNRPVVGAGVLLVGAFGLAGLLVPSTGWLVVAALLVFAVGYKGFGPVMQAYLMDTFPDASKGGDLGAVRTVYMTLGSLGPAYVGVVAARASYTLAFAGFVVCFLVAGGITLWLARASR